MFVCKLKKKNKEIEKRIQIINKIFIKHTYLNEIGKLFKLMVIFVSATLN